MLNQIKCFIMNLGSKKEVLGNNISGSCAKLSLSNDKIELKLMGKNNLDPLSYGDLEFDV